jgi:hypothetical protein
MDPFEAILTSSPTKSVAPELLEMLGNRASAMFRNGTSLNSAITQLVAEHPELTNEHIKRVVEFANNVTFQNLFQNSDDKNIHFDVADPGVVLRDLRDGGSPAHDGKTMDVANKSMKDYSSPPNMEKNDFADPESGMQHLFQMNDQNGRMGQGEAIEKNASENTEHTSHANPVEDVYDMHVKLQASRGELTRAHETFDFLEKQAEQNLYEAVKKEILDPYGAGLGGVLGALKKVASDAEIFRILSPMTERLAQTVGPEPVDDSLEKRAGKMVNYSHPVVLAWGGLMKAAEEKRRSFLALEEIDKGLEQTHSFLASVR